MTVLNISNLTFFQSIENETINGTFQNVSEDEFDLSYLGHHEQPLRVALEFLLSALLAFVMLAMGADITWSDLLKHLKKPTGIIIGMTSQFVILPLCAFSLSHLFKLPAYQAMSLVIVSCCPGGVASNLFTIWCKGNISLSICMTTMSTFLALGMMPLNLFVYSLSWVNENVHVPFDKLAVTLVTIFIPVLVGVTIKSRYPKAAPWIMRLGSTAGFLSIIASVIIQSLLIPGLFDCGWHVYFASFLLPLMGFFFGYFWSFIFRMSHKDCRTVAMETGSQNIPLALTIVLLSFPVSAQKDMTPYPMLFIIFVIIEAIITALIFNWWLRVRQRKKEQEILNKIKSIPVENNPYPEEETTMLPTKV